MIFGWEQTVACLSNAFCFPSTNNFQILGPGELLSRKGRCCRPMSSKAHQECGGYNAANKESFITEEQFLEVNQAKMPTGGSN